MKNKPDMPRNKEFRRLMKRNNLTRPQVCKLLGMKSHPTKGNSNSTLDDWLYDMKQIQPTTLELFRMKLKDRGAITKAKAA